ncbi:MAG: sulfatase-like hydrolase/transferase [Phycisphaera sp.]|nr:sulfatase-like hydrolase/transferase [Phycisphaera sp.]
MRVSILIFVTCLCVSVGVGAGAPRGSHAADKPNILFILADDLAWSDLRCYGHPWHDTPHLDALARQGVRFTDGYAPAPICSASRAGTLTGRTPARLHFEFVTKDTAGDQHLDQDTPLRAPPYTIDLPLEEKTIPEYLNALGYETGFFGKWHLNKHYQRYLGWSPTHGPKQQGFTVAVEDFGSHPYVWGKRDPEPIDTPGVFPADTMIDRCVAFVQQQRGTPFFLMASQFYVHTPVRTPCRWLIKKYEARIPADSPNRDQRVTYAAFVEQLDHHVGRILDALDEAGLRDRTLVVFTSDNGGHPEYTANGPLRGSKWNTYEGGIRVPFIVRWPGHTAAGSTCAEPVVGYDLLPTFVDVAGGAATDVDGVSLAPLFDDPTRHFDRALVWHFPYYHPECGYRDALKDVGVDDFALSKTTPQSAIRRGDDKLIYFYEDHHVELYHLSGDTAEQHDLRETQPKLAQELTDELQSRLKLMDARLPVRR